MLAAAYRAPPAQRIPRATCQRAPAAARSSVRAVDASAFGSSGTTSPGSPGTSRSSGIGAPVRVRAVVVGAPCPSRRRARGRGGRSRRSRSRGRSGGPRRMRRRVPRGCLVVPGSVAHASRVGEALRVHGLGIGCRLDLRDRVWVPAPGVDEAEQLRGSGRVAASSRARASSPAMSAISQATAGLSAMASSTMEAKRSSPSASRHVSSAARLGIHGERLRVGLISLRPVNPIRSYSWPAAIISAACCSPRRCASVSEAADVAGRATQLYLCGGEPQPGGRQVVDLGHRAEGRPQPSPSRRCAAAARAAVSW